MRAGPASLSWIVSHHLSASNCNWVCFDCRFVTRQAKMSRHIPKCADCGSDCYCLGYKVEIPKKADRCVQVRLEGNRLICEVVQLP